MKNLHLLDADKPSRLFYLTSNLHLEQGQLIAPKNYQHIYITNDEEIKVGDWLLKCKNINDWNFKSGELEEKDYSYFAVKCVSLALINPEDKKIILTTDQSLDGVQAIDDEFLEWFVKNPSCEEIEVQKWFDGVDFLEYKIIIPKEKPKQETLEEVADSWVRKPIIGTKRESFIKGTKWQQERMYSEEEVVQLLIKFNQEIQEVEDVRGWFEEFKKN